MLCGQRQFSLCAQGVNGFSQVTALPWARDAAAIPRISPLPTGSLSFCTSHPQACAQNGEPAELPPACTPSAPTSPAAPPSPTSVAPAGRDRRSRGGAPAPVWRERTLAKRVAVTIEPGIHLPRKTDPASSTPPLSVLAGGDTHHGHQGTARPATRGRRTRAHQARRTARSTHTPRTSAPAAPPAQSGGDARLIHL